MLIRFSMPIIIIQRGNLTSMMDIMILGATEVDLNFNGNVVTHSDGYLLHGIGGWQNCLHARNVRIPLPLLRQDTCHC